MSSQDDRDRGENGGGETPRPEAAPIALGHNIGNASRVYRCCCVVERNRSLQHQLSDLCNEHDDDSPERDNRETRAYRLGKFEDNELLIRTGYACSYHNFKNQAAGKYSDANVDQPANYRIDRRLEQRLFFDGELICGSERFANGEKERAGNFVPVDGRDVAPNHGECAVFERG